MGAKFIILIFVTFLPFNAPLAVLQLLDVAKSTVDLILKVKEAWQFIDNYEDFNDILSNEKNQVVFNKMETILIQLEEASSTVQRIEHNVDDIVKQLSELPATIDFKQQFKNIQNYHKEIDKQFNEMKKILPNRDLNQFAKYENSTIINFVNHVVSNRVDSGPMLILMLHYSISDQAILNFSLEKLNEMDENIFPIQYSPQQWFLLLLQQYLKTEAKSYVTIQLAYMIKSRYGQGYFKVESKEATSNFKNRTNSFIMTIKKYAAAASRELWKRDPRKHIDGKTFVAFINFTRGYVINEILLNSKKQCYDGCSAMSYTKHNVECGNDKWCQETMPTCSHVLECQKINDKLKVCLGKTPERRYEYIEQNNGRRFGKKSTCSRPYYLDSYKYRMLWTCSYCFCLCDEGGTNTSHTFINLRSVIADIKNNRVVTGVKFVKHNRILHLQIQEGQLLPQGMIDNDTVRWVPVENYEISDSYIFEGIDYHTITWLDRRLDLQTITAKNGSVVTGLRFRKFGQSIYLEIVSTPFNFATGKLHYKKSVRQAVNHFLYRFQKEIHLTKPDIPTRSFSSIPDHSGDYIQFRPTDFDKDAAQTTVPFFDAQPVESLMPFPLTGLGIFYKGAKGFGGFITPKIYTYDYSQHLQAVFSEEHQNL